MCSFIVQLFLFPSQNLFEVLGTMHDWLFCSVNFAAQYLLRRYTKMVCENFLKISITPRKNFLNFSYPNEKSLNKTIFTIFQSKPVDALGCRKNTKPWPKKNGKSIKFYPFFHQRNILLNKILFRRKSI